MRRRPDVKLYLKPSVGVAGGEVLAEAVLTSGSATPVSAITMMMRGSERVGAGDGYANHPILAQRASFGPRTLEKGEHRVAARFPIPHSAPPSYAGRFVVIEYELEVRVEIPWWIDRRERYVVPVTRRVPELVSEAPRVFANRGQKDEPYIEATLDDQNVEQTSAISGAASFSNVARARIKQIDFELQQREAVVYGSAAPTWWTIATFVSTILDRAPTEGETVRFRVGLPAGAVQTLTGTYGRVSWTAAIVCVVARGTDVRVNIPITVLPVARAARVRRRVELPAVGRERRALLLRAAAERLEVDCEGEELRSTFGFATAVVRLESREGVGLVAVIELGWPSLGIDLELRERKWTDAFGDEVELADASFKKRFRVAARDSEHVERLLDGELRPSLVALTEVEIDDEGAVLAAPITLHSVEAIVDALRPTIATARMLADAASRLAPAAGYR